MKIFFPLLAALFSGSASLFGQVTFQTVSQDGNVITFTWSSVSGAVYQVQYNTNLSSGVWTNLGSPILATNSTANATDPIGPDMARFYRLTSLVDSNTAPPLPPAIVISEPLNNALFIASSTNITMIAAATATVGNPKVQFFQGATSLGVLATPPYNLVWSNAPCWKLRNNGGGDRRWIEHDLGNCERHGDPFICRRQFIALVEGGRHCRVDKLCAGRNLE
jgi:hypothetical protein